MQAQFKGQLETQVLKIFGSGPRTVNGMSLKDFGKKLDKLETAVVSNRCSAEAMGSDLLPYIFQKLSKIEEIESELDTTKTELKNLLKLTRGDLDQIAATVVPMEVLQISMVERLEAVEDQSASASSRLDSIALRQNEQKELLGSLQAEVSSEKTKPALPDELKTDLQELRLEVAAIKELAQNLGQMIFNDTGFFDFLKLSDQTAVGYASRQRSLWVYFDALQRAVEFAETNRVPGNIVEFGSYQGFTARIFARLLQVRLLDRHLYLIDSFEGFPEISGDVDPKSYEVKQLEVWGKGVCAVDEETLVALRKDMEAALGSRAHVIRSFYADLEPDLFGPVAVLHLDCDLYESTVEALDYCVENDALQDGTVFLLDDYNCSRANSSLGQRRAVTDFLSKYPNYRLTEWFSYGWHGQASILSVTDPAKDT